MFHFQLKSAQLARILKIAWIWYAEWHFLRPLQFHGTQVGFGCKPSLQSSRQISYRHNGTFLTNLGNSKLFWCRPYLCDVVRYWFNFVKYRPLCILGVQQSYGIDLLCIEFKSRIKLKFASVIEMNVEELNENVKPFAYYFYFLLEVVFVKYDWCNQRRRFLFSYKLCKKYVWLRQWNRRRKRKKDIRNVVIATIYIGPVSENVTITYRIHVLWDIKIISGRWSTYRHRITRIAQFSIAQLIVWLHTKTYAFGNYKIKANIRKDKMRENVL